MTWPIVGLFTHDFKHFLKNIVIFILIFTKLYTLHNKEQVPFTTELQTAGNLIHTEGSLFSRQLSVSLMDRSVAGFSEDILPTG